MNTEVLSDFLAELMARTDADSLYLRVRSGPKTASMETLESEIEIPDTLDALLTQITDLISRASADPEHKIAYVEVVQRGSGKVVKRLPVKLVEDDNALNIVPAKGTGTDGILAIQLVRMAESYKGMFEGLLTKYGALQGKYADLALIQQSYVTEMQVRGEVAEQLKLLESKEFVAGMLKQYAPLISIAVAKAAGIPPEVMSQMMGGTFPGAAPGEPIDVEAPPESEGTPDEIADRTIQRVLWLAANHPATFTESRLAQVQQAVMAALSAMAADKGGAR